MRCPEEIAVGALVLNALEPDEQQHLQQHLAGCAVCSHTFTELAELPHVLARVVPDDASAEPEAPPAMSELAFQRLRQQAAVRPRRPHQRFLLVAAALLVLVGGGVVAGLETADRTVLTSTVSATDGTVRARAELTSSESGTSITLVLDGVRPGEQCQLIVVGRDGREEIASTWTATYSGEASVMGSVGMQPREFDRMIIRTLDGRTLLTLEARLPK